MTVRISKPLVRWMGLGLAAAVLGVGLCPASAREQVRCLTGDSFQVAFRPQADAVGSEIVVRPLPKTGASMSACTLERGPGSFKVGGKEASYVLGLAGDMLVLDQGTGPDRVLAIYDLAARRTALKAAYDDGKPVTIRPGSVAFTAVTGPGSAATCPEFASLAASGLGAALTQRAQVSLPSARLTLSGPVGCIARQ